MSRRRRPDVTVPSSQLGHFHDFADAEGLHHHATAFVLSRRVQQLHPSHSARTPDRSLSVASQTGEMTVTDEQEALAALKSRANKLGHQIEPSVKNQRYCLWQTWPDGRVMILGRNHGVTLDAIAEKLDEIEAAKHEAGND